MVVSADVSAKLWNLTDIGKSIPESKIKSRLRVRPHKHFGVVCGRENNPLRRLGGAGFPADYGSRRQKIGRVWLRLAPPWAVLLCRAVGLEVVLGHKEPAPAYQLRAGRAALVYVCGRLWLLPAVGLGPEQKRTNGEHDQGEHGAAPVASCCRAASDCGFGGGRVAGRVAVLRGQKRRYRAGRGRGKWRGGSGRVVASGRGRWRRGLRCLASGRAIWCGLPCGCWVRGLRVCVVSWVGFVVVCGAFKGCLCLSCSGIPSGLPEGRGGASGAVSGSRERERLRGVRAGRVSPRF